VTAVLFLTLAGLGFLGAFVAGLVGVGGAIVMVPLLYYVPPLLALPGLDIKEVAGVTMTQVLATALLGAVLHGRRGAWDRRLAVAGGAAMAAGSLAGALGSRFVDGRVLLLTFAIMGGLALPLMYAAPADRAEAAGAPPYRPVLAVAAPGTIGVLAGMVGAGGGFLLMPVLTGLLRVPFRDAIGTSLTIVVASAATGFAGKLLTRQVPLWPAVAVLVGSLPGVPLGVRLSRRAPVAVLRHVLAVLIALATVRVLVDVVRH
jgi:uncharacterized membrane protein YfcA